MAAKPKQAENGTMTTVERSDLARVVRMRAKIARADIDAQIAKQLARLETQLSAFYSAQDEHWKELTEEAAAMIRQTDAEIARRCRDLGIPEQFRPSIHLSWYGRGENASSERRTELRRLAQVRLEAAAKTAKGSILRAEVDLLEKITAHGLTSDASKNLLANLPTADQLMPKIELAELEKHLALPANETVDIDD